MALDQKIILQISRDAIELTSRRKVCFRQTFFQIEVRNVLYKVVMVTNPQDPSGRIHSPSKLGNMKNVKKLKIPKHVPTLQLHNYVAKLQRVQNAAMRIVLGKKKQETVTSDYKDLHWLTIEQRIVFKVLLLVFKCLNDMGPVPLTNLLVPKFDFDNYTPAIRLEESTYRAKTIHGKRAFVFYAPRIWNCLPDQLRACCNLSTFKQLLKTYIFGHFDILKRAINKYVRII